jgi:FolB domain-containing protein
MGETKPAALIMATITITDLEVSFHVGVPEAERARPQRLLISLEMQSDFTRAAAADDIAHTIDYHAVCQTVTGLGTGRSWKLIEKLAHDIADKVMDRYHPETITVVVKKFVLPQTAHVSVTLKKNRPGAKAVQAGGVGSPVI